jgi:hypothetical protein
MRTSGWGALTVLAMTACRETATTVATGDAAPASPAEVAKLRTEALAQVRPYEDRPEYQVNDADFVDPCVEKELRANGNVVPTGAERAHVVLRIKLCVDDKLHTPDGLARIEKLVAARYARPVVTRNGTTARIDVGVLPGTLGLFGGKLQIEKSPYLDRNEWATSEVVRFFQIGIAQLPDTRAYEIKISVPNDSQYPIWWYVFDRADDRIWVLPHNGSGGRYTPASPKLGATSRTRSHSTRPTSTASSTPRSRYRRGEMVSWRRHVP